MFSIFKHQQRDVCLQSLFFFKGSKSLHKVVFVHRIFLRSVSVYAIFGLSDIKILKHVKPIISYYVFSAKSKRTFR